MADIEKTIDNLKILRTWCAVTPSYGIGLSCRECEKAVGWLDDALELLKAKQPVKPHRNYQYLSDYWCACGWHLGKAGSVKYCPECGRKVDWEWVI